MAAMAAPTTALIPTADASLDGKGALLYKLESNESGCACKGTSGCGILKEVSTIEFYPGVVTVNSVATLQQIGCCWMKYTFTTSKSMPRYKIDSATIEGSDKACLCGLCSCNCCWKPVASLTLTMEHDAQAGLCASLLGMGDDNQISILVNASQVNTDIVLGYVYGGQASEPGFLAKVGGPANPRPAIEMER